MKRVASRSSILATALVSDGCQVSHMRDIDPLAGFNFIVQLRYVVKSIVNGGQDDENDVCTSYCHW